MDRSKGNHIDFLYHNTEEAAFNKRCCLNCIRNDTELCYLTEKEKSGIDIAIHKCELFDWI